MIDLNKMHHTPDNKKYDIAEAAKILKLGFGRTTLYKILKELEIVNDVMYRMKNTKKKVYLK